MTAPIKRLNDKGQRAESKGKMNKGNNGTGVRGKALPEKAFDDDKRPAGRRRS
jgi:hypothetical protein